MSIILAIRLLIAIAVIVFAVRLWFRLFRPQVSPERVRRATRTVFIVIGLLIAIEQSFLHFWLDKAVQQRREEHMAFLEKVKSRPGGLESIKRKYCEKRRVALIYSYKLCIYRGSPDPESGRPGFTVRIQKPSGYLTLVPWDYPDRILFDGVSLYGVNADGEITGQALEGKVNDG